jgi:hypothetical protein
MRRFSLGLLLAFLFAILTAILLWFRPGLLVHDAPPELDPTFFSLLDDDPVQGEEPHEVYIDYQKSCVIARTPTGEVDWSVQLNGPFGYVRDPHILTDGERVYLSHQDGVTALDRRSGDVLWHATGPQDRLYLRNDKLWAVCCSDSQSGPPQGRWLTAYDVVTGAERHRTPLPLTEFDPAPIRDVAGLLLLESDGFSTGWRALLIDSEGQIRHRFDRQVVAGIRDGEDHIILTDRNVVRITADDKTKWTAPFSRTEFVARGGMVVLVDGDLLAFLYCAISDSGVQVLRLDPLTGRQVWQTHIDPLGVAHSKYHHEASIRVVGGQVKVTSRASSGTFVELLDLRTGRPLQRKPAVSQ